MSVFTTRSLLHALGVSRGNSASSAVAVNWVIKVLNSSCNVSQGLFEAERTRRDFGYLNLAWTSNDNIPEGLSSRT